MKKLIIDAKPLLLHNMKQAQIGLGQYEVFCQKTFKETIDLLCKQEYPDKIEWKYPEQALTTRQMAFIASILDKIDMEISILSATCIWATHCRMDDKCEIIGGKSFGFDAYGHDFSYLWEHIQ